MKKVCFFLTTRGNYAKTKTVIDGLRGKVEIQYIIGGHCPPMKFHGEVRHITMIPTGSYSGTYKTAGIISIEAGCILQELMPDVLVIVADRFECLPMAMIAHYMGIPIAHIEGGEESGSIDDKIRNAITHLATLHFPCTMNAFDKIRALKGGNDLVYNVGATSLDMLRLHKDDELPGIKKPYLVVTYHTRNVGIADVDDEFRNLLWAISDLGMETYWMRPNIDTDSVIINGMLNKMQWPFIHVFDSFRIEEYAPLLASAACIVGNSSSGIREASFLGTPVVNIGDRQIGRDRAANVLDVEAKSKKISNAIISQVGCGKYAPDYTYGEGHAGERIAEELFCYLGLTGKVYDAA